MYTYKALYNTQRIRQFSLLLFCLSLQTHIAYSATLKHHNTKYYQYQNDYWRLYPISLQLHVHQGLRLPAISLIALPEKHKKEESLKLFGFSADLNMLYVNKSLWQYFNFYPRLGLAFNYHKLTDQGNIYSGLIYVEPNHNYATSYEFLPKLGIGIAYAKTSNINNNVTPNPEETDTTPNRDEIYGYLQGSALALTLDMGNRFRLTPQWNLYVGLGINYLLTLKLPKDQYGQFLQKNRLTFYNFNLAGSYTFNPNPKIFILTQIPKKSRIHIGTFHTFAKAPWQDFTVNYTKQAITHATPSTDTQAKIKDKEVYYIFGLYAQGSVQLANNHALTIGSEWVYNNGIKKANDNHANVKSTSLLNALSTSKFQKSFLLGHEFLWGKVTFGQNIGGYVFNEAYQTNPLFGSFYTRLTFNCYVTKFLSVGSSIKTNILPNPRQYIEFDYIDFRIGYIF